MQKQTFTRSFLYAAVNFASTTAAFTALGVYAATGETIVELKRLGLGLVFVPLFVLGVFEKFITNGADSTITN